jgi:peptide/nickel transport system substrate-binding protein
VGEYVNSDLKDHPFDPAEGNRILDKAGYKDSDGDGIREYSDGSPLKYRLYGLEGGTRTRILEIIADGLSQIGIKAEIAVLREDAKQALYPAHDFDLLSRSWFIDPDPDFLLSLFTCGSRCISKKACGWSDCGYCNPEYDKMYTRQAELLNYQERKDLIWKMQEVLYNELPYIMLFYGQDIIAYNTKRFKIDPEAANMRLRSAITHGKYTPR